MRARFDTRATEVVAGRELRYSAQCAGGEHRMTEPTDAKPLRDRAWGRLIGARALTVLAILLARIGMVAFYVEHTALDEEGFETISRKMIENDEIRTQVAAKSVDTLFDN